MELTGIRQKVFLDRYALRDKDGSLLESTPEQMWKRVAWGISQNEKKKDQKYWESEFYRVMDEFKFVPAGRILSGAGTNYQVTYFNCFIIPSPKDSRDGILESLKQLVEIQSRAGGVGLNLSSLRPRGARVKKVNGTSSGPVTWAGLFSYATHDVVQQGGSRRGATMLMLWDWHPDIEEFITVKEDLSKINGANLSVCVSDKFMEAVKADADWDLVYPDIDDPEYDAKWDGEIDTWRELGKKVNVHKTVKARYIWDLICTAAWKSAEPGLHFMERSNKRSNTWYFEKLIATNPSLRAGTKVLTKEGIFPIEQLQDKKFLVKNLDGEWSKAECFLSGKNKSLYKITLNNGKEIFATAEHKWPILSVGGGFGKVTTDKLKAGNILPFPKTEDIAFKSKNPLSYEQGFMVGWLYGDGWISERGTGKVHKDTLLKRGISQINAGFLSPQAPVNFSNLLDIKTIKNNFSQKTNDKKEMVFGFLFSKEDKVMAEGILTEINKLKKTPSSLTKAHDNTYTIQSTSDEFAQNLSMIFGVDKKEKGFPESVWKAGGDYIKGFVDALISSDGFVSRNSNRIVFTSKHKKIAEDLSSLLSFYGIKSNIRRSEATQVKFPNQKEYSRAYERYDVYVEGNNIIMFNKIFKVSHRRKAENIQRIVSEYKVSRAFPDHELMRIKSVEKTDIKENVWDISVYDDTHCFYIDQCVTGNCGEQPLGAWAVCNLGAMNLSAYVKDADLTTETAGWFDYESFGKDAKVAMRLLDNVIDQTYYFFKENEKCAKEIRRTGLGIMGLGDALIKMQLPYGSEASMPVIEKIFRTLRDNAYEASTDMAKEKGSFPKFDKEKYLEGYHIKALPKKIRDQIAEKGIRNAVLLTIAPTGTTSLVSGVSSGVEPVYEFSFLRRWRGGEEIVYHPLFEEWKKAHPEGDKPGYFVSANDLIPSEHAKVQAVAQDFIDSSISKTVNAPNSHTIDDVKNLYMMAYDMGLKGVTYMRDGSRQGVLERVDDKKKEEEVKAAQAMPIRKRPLALSGVTHETQTPLGNTFITINHDSEGKPFELFINSGKSGSDVMAMSEALGRIMSMVLRIQSPVEPRERIREMIDQLTGIGGGRSVGFGPNRVRSLPDAVAKVLAEHFEFRVNGHVADKVGMKNIMADALKTDVVATPVVETPKVEAPVVAVQAPLPMVSAAPQSHANADLCPECGAAAFVHEEGCAKCYACGHAEC